MERMKNLFCWSLFLLSWWQSVHASDMIKMMSATDFKLSSWKNFKETLSDVTSFPHLNAVQLDINCNLTGFNFDDLLKKFPNPESISASGCHKIDTATYPTNPAPHFKSFSIRQIDGFNDIDLTKFPNIKTLQATGKQIDKALGSLKNEITTLTNIELQDTSLKQIDCRNFPNLRECTFAGVSDLVKTVIFNCPDLEYLEVSSSKSNDDVKITFIGLEKSTNKKNTLDFSINDIKLNFKNVTFEELTKENLDKHSVVTTEESPAKELTLLQSSLKALRDRLGVLSNALAALKKQLGLA